MFGTWKIDWGIGIVGVLVGIDAVDLGLDQIVDGEGGQEDGVVASLVDERECYNHDCYESKLACLY